MSWTIWMTCEGWPHAPGGDLSTDEIVGGRAQRVMEGILHLPYCQVETRAGHLLGDPALFLEVPEQTYGLALVLNGDENEQAHCNTEWTPTRCTDSNWTFANPPAFNWEWEWNE